ncbi:hypothetical protein RN001_004003 [Aquatica leii]|uniref:Major facilitator superfamily (MFS) profile domain-containing protein n=1 Tax=Aquatica leii TaxID=1421715 RepID=A0AAN7SL47_9COLE|nr:hypothetical protein RN001_004003 [Aquatica leii]
MLRTIKMIPPDGGWGWVIMFAYVLSNFIFIPIQQNFGLLFKDTFKSLGLSGSKVTSIIGTNMALSCLIGIAAGPLVNRFKIRKIAFAGSVLFCVGFISTVFANTYLEFLMYYGIINGIGLGILRLTAQLSLNLYFLKRRNKVVGVTLGLRSLGSIVMPQLIVLLLATYGIKSAVLYIGGLSLHLLCTSLFLQPVEWHSKLANDEPEIELVNLLSDDDKMQDSKENIVNKIVNMFDLTLFRNDTFLIITIGMMFSVFADVNFSTLFALILEDLNFSNQQIAIFISTSYISNVIVRILSPFVGDFFKLSSRLMYLLSILMVISGRFAITYLGNAKLITAISVLWGAAKGVRTVYWGVIIADNVSPERLASAESIQMVLNGILMLIGGSLLGFIKDVTGSYVNCVYLLNALSFVTFLLWSTEMIYKKMKKNKCEPLVL